MLLPSRVLCFHACFALHMISPLMMFMRFWLSCPDTLHSTPTVYRCGLPAHWFTMTSFSIRLEGGQKFNGRPSSPSVVFSDDSVADNSTTAARTSKRGIPKLSQRIVLRLSSLTRGPPEKMHLARRTCSSGLGTKPICRGIQKHTEKAAFILHPFSTPSCGLDVARVWLG